MIIPAPKSSIRLPPPPPTPFVGLNTWLESLYKELARLDGENRKLQRDLEVSRTERFILPDADGLRYEVRVDAAGPTVEATLLPS